MLIYCCMEERLIPNLTAACRSDSLPSNIRYTVCNFSECDILLLDIKCSLPGSKRFYFFSCLPRREHIKVYRVRDSPLTYSFDSIFSLSYLYFFTYFPITKKRLLVQVPLSQVIREIIGFPTLSASALSISSKEVLGTTLVSITLYS